jgi:hypothetical protein
VTLAYLASDHDQAKEGIVTWRAEVATMSSQRQEQKESRSRGGLLSLFDGVVELAKEAPSTYPNVSFS